MQLGQRCARLLSGMRAQFADEPARARILVEQLRAHAAVFDHLRKIRRDAARQRVDLRERRMLGARHQQIQIADQHVASTPPLNS